MFNRKNISANSSKIVDLVLLVNSTTVLANASFGCSNYFTSSDPHHDISII